MFYSNGEEDKYTSPIVVVGGRDCPSLEMVRSD